MRVHVFLTGTVLLVVSRLGLDFGLMPLSAAAVATLLGLVAYAEVAADLLREWRSLR